MNVIVVSFYVEDEYGVITDEIVGAARDWHAALLVARQHMSDRIVYDATVNVNRETPVNRTRQIIGGQYVMRNTTLHQEAS